MNKETRFLLTIRTIIRFCWQVTPNLQESSFRAPIKTSSIWLLNLRSMTSKTSLWSLELYKVQNLSRKNNLSLKSRTLLLKKKSKRWCLALSLRLSRKSLKKWILLDSQAMSALSRRKKINPLNLSFRKTNLNRTTWKMKKKLKRKWNNLKKSSIDISSVISAVRGVLWASDISVRYVLTMTYVKLAKLLQTILILS